MLENNEIWKDIKGYPNYQISNYRRIWSKYKNGYIKPHLKKTGYLQVRLVAINGKQKSESVHRLVALNFIDNPYSYPVVNHKDGNKQNNHVENLEWCTVSENTKHAFDNNLGNFRETSLNSLNKLNNEYNPHNVSVEAYYKGEYIDTYKSIAEAARELEIDAKTVWNRIHNKYSSRSGWDFKEVVK